MNFKLTFLTVTAFSLFGACSNQNSDKKLTQESTGNPITKVVQTKADSILDLAILAHGVDHLKNSTYQFKFRDKEYEMTRTNNGFEYKVSVKTDSSEYVDYLNNGNFERSSQGNIVKLSDKEVAKYSNALNSVIYFATLPEKLNDDAVNKKFIGLDTIKNSEYFMLEVTFEELNGGQDHDDEFNYWINSTTHEIDYLAYNYQVNGGGVRFRAAYNKSKVDGVLFQDYINFKAKVGTPLRLLSNLYVVDSLKEISRIETYDILKKN